jgi:hypothetical protein
MNKSETLTKLASALTKAQAEMSGAKKSAANPFFKSKYANLEEVIQCVKEPFANHGLSFMQFPISEDGCAGVETIILHESGEFISNSFMLKCAKADPQGMGSAITYARRYGLQAACGIPSEDDDAEGAMKRTVSPTKPAPKPMTKAEAVELLANAKDATELQAAWGKISVELKTNADVIGIKDARKAEFNLSK